jgi:hypothetical protein
MNQNMKHIAGFIAVFTLAIPGIAILGYRMPPIDIPQDPPYVYTLPSEVPTYTRGEWDTSEGTRKLLRSRIEDFVRVNYFYAVPPAEDFGTVTVTVTDLFKELPFAEKREVLQVVYKLHASKSHEITVQANDGITNHPLGFMYAPNHFEWR